MRTTTTTLNLMLASRVEHIIRVLRKPLTFGDPVPHLLLVPVYTRLALLDSLLGDGDGHLSVHLTRVREVREKCAVGVREGRGERGKLLRAGDDHGVRELAGLRDHGAEAEARVDERVYGTGSQH